MTKSIKAIRGKKAASRNDNGMPGNALSRAVLRAGAPRGQSVARVEAVASLSSGLSHELNNVLTIALGNVSLLRAHLRGSKSRAMLDDALASIDEAVRISGKLDAIGNQDGLSLRPVDVSAFVARYAASARWPAGEAVSIVVRSKGRFGPVLVDPRYLEQALDALLQGFPEDKASPAIVTIELGPGDCGGTATGGCQAVSICIHDSRDRLCQPARSQRPGETDPLVNECPWPDIGMWFVRQIALACGGSFSTVIGERDKPCVCITLPCL